MGDNTKKEKEEELLESTFGNYDSQLSSDTANSTFDTKTAGDKKKKNTNKIIFMVVGFVAVLMVVYAFILPMFMGPQAKNTGNKQPNKPANNNATNNATNNAPAKAPAPSLPTPVNTGLAPQAPTPATSAPADNNSQVSSFLNQQGSMPPPPPSDLASTTPASSNLNLPSPTVPTVSEPMVAAAPIVSNVQNVPNVPSVVAPAPAVVVSEPVAINLPTTPTVVVSAPAPAAPAVVVSSNSPVSGDNAALLNEMKSFFGSQFSEVRSDIGKFNQDLAKNSAATVALTDTVRDLETRLRKLEGRAAPAKANIPAPASLNSGVVVNNAPAVPVSIKTNDSTSGTTSTVSENKERKTFVRTTKRYTKPAHVVRQERAEKEEDNLLNARSERRAARQERSTEKVERFNDETVIVNKAERKMAPAAAPTERVMPAYKIHSLYAGRVWIANPDNTQSNFSVGDRLPNGELIKNIDMEKRAIVTDRGTISAR